MKQTFSSVLLTRYGIPFCLLLTGIVLAAGVCEMALRLAGFEAFDSIHVYDHDAGVRLRAGYSGTYTREGHTDFTFNSRGFRDKEHDFQKPPGVFRILVLGDSYVEALQVPFEQTMVSMLEREFNRSADCRFEVINLGVSGYGTAQEYIILSEEGIKYDPDLVLLMMTPQNDIRNNSKDLEPDWKNIPFFTLDNGKLVADMNFRQYKTTWVQQIKHTWRTVQPYSVFLSQLVYRMKIVAAQLTTKKPSGATSIASGPATSIPVKSDLNVFDTDPMPVWRQSWTVTLALIRSMSDLCEKKGIAFGMISVPAAMSVYPEQWADLQRKYTNMGSKDWDRDHPEQRLTVFARRCGIPYLNLVPVFRAHYEKHHEALHFDKVGHWTRTGHEVAGQATLNFIQMHFQTSVD